MKESKKSYVEVKLEQSKQDFIADCIEKGYSDQTIQDITNLMRKTQAFEVVSSKEFYNFSKTDLVRLMNMFFSLSPATMRTYKNVYENYFDFVIRKGYRYTEDNPASMLDSEDLDKLYIDKTKEKYITREELYEEVLPLIRYPAQKLAIALTFEGIRGTACADAIALKKENFDTENKNVTYIKEYKDHKYDTIITIEDDRFWEIYKEVMNYHDDYYYSKNGRSKIMKIDTATEYIFKPTTKQLKNDEKNNVNPEKKIVETAYETMIREAFKLEEINKPYMTINTVYLSGIMDRLYMIEQEMIEGGELTSVEVANAIDEMKDTVSPYPLYKIFVKFKDKIRNDYNDN